MRLHTRRKHPILMALDLKPDKVETQRAGLLKRTLRWLALLLLLVAVGWSLWVRHQILAVAEQDYAQRADAIAVFGRGGVCGPAFTGAACTAG